MTIEEIENGTVFKVNESWPHKYRLSKCHRYLEIKRVDGLGGEWSFHACISELDKKYIKIFTNLADKVYHHKIFIKNLIPAI